MHVLLRGMLQYTLFLAAALHIVSCRCSTCTGAPRGVIPQVMDAIFGRIAAAPRDIEFSVRVGFVEIHKASRQLLRVFYGWQERLLHTKVQALVVFFAECPGNGTCVRNAAGLPGLRERLPASQRLGNCTSSANLFLGTPFSSAGGDPRPAVHPRRPAPRSAHP